MVGVQTSLMPTVTANRVCSGSGVGGRGGWGSRPGAWPSQGAPGSRHLFPVAQSARPPSPSSLPGDQPRRGAPGAERLPQEARLRAGHLRRLPGGGRRDPRELPWWRRGTVADPAPLPRCRQVCLKYYEYEFMELACQCPAVVCCRCAPTQKAQIVRLLQERTGRLTCAVGRPAAAPAHLRGTGPLRLPRVTFRGGAPRLPVTLQGTPGDLWGTGPPRLRWATFGGGAPQPRAAGSQAP